MTTEAQAWLLSYGQGQAAIAVPELLEVIRHPVTEPFPALPPWCAGILIWRDQPIPLVDLRHVLRTAEPCNTVTFSHCALVRYSSGDTSIGFGGILLTQAPEPIVVTSAEAIAVSDELRGPQGVVLACFGHQNEPVPIIDLDRVFSSRPSEMSGACQPIFDVRPGSGVSVATTQPARASRMPI
ncbi:chemotaxis protein CheW [Thiocystis violacea]|uniref:chemotaxis protein CheW n=1 Tax=Thiocystis violacea TaxID=13725 RepID=UPI0019037271|nr:chemotaxis protein CheW [Thiocystis violacea]MBK1722950.1 hypothetical protein [Thiocystis violacea]